MYPELQNFVSYFKALYRHGGVVAGSFVLTGILWAMDQWNPSFWQTPPNWLSPSLVAGGFLLAHYLAWREAWLKRPTPEKPYLPKGIELIQVVSHTYGDTPEKTGFELMSKTDLRGRAIRIFCDGPIYLRTASFIAYATPGLGACREDIRVEDTHSVIFDFSGERLEASPFNKISGEVSSIVPLRITRVEWSETKPLTKKKGQ